MAALDSYDSEKVKKILDRRAEKELKENPQQIQAHLTSFRRWLKSMPHLSCSSDDDFLLAFLRHSKYNHQKAQIRLDNYCTFRTSESLGRPDWFNEQDDDFELYKKVLDMRMSCPLGTLEDGTFIVIIKMANYDFSVPYQRLTQLNSRLDERLLVTKGIQVAGIAPIFDFTGASAKQLKMMFSAKESKDHSKYYQEALPFRTRKMIFFNTPSFFENLFNLVRHYLNDKIRSRLTVLSESLEPAMNELPGLKTILPREYGGDGPSLDELCAKYRHLNEEAFLSRRDFNIRVDESKRPSTSRNLMRVYNDVVPESMGKSGTFVKLADDDI